MNDDIASLQIKIESLEAAVASKRLGTLGTQGAKAERATDGLNRSAAKLAIGLAAVAAGLKSVTASLDSFSKLETLNDQLVTAVGSLEAANLQFGALNRLSATTPFQLEEVVESFIKLKNLGLDPSEEALLSYGNTASALSKNLDQLIEAVADAAVGEFERLKEFGIKASVEGDNIQFRFNKMTTTVKNSSEQIQKFLLDLGQNEFAGGMELRADNLDTAFSNLGAATDLLTAKLSDDSGLADAAKTASEAITDLFNSIVGVPRSVAFLESEIARLTETMDVVGRGRNKGNGVAIRVKELREELRSAREISADANDIEKVISQLDAEIVGFQATLDKFDGAAPRATVKRSGRQRGGSRVNPEAKEFQEATTGLEAAIARREALQDRIEALNKPGEAGGVDDRGSTASAAIERRIQALEMEEKQLGKTRRQSELLKLENQGATVEELALADAALTGIEAFERRNEELQSALDLEEEQRHAFQSLQESLRTEEEAITESYERRLAIILQNTEEGADRQIDLIDRLNERLRAQIDDLESEDFWTNYLNSASDALTDFDELAATTIENFSTGFGNAFEKMIFDSESLGDAAAGMAEGMARSVVSALGKMGAEWLAYQAVQMVVGKTTQATAAAGIIANAQAASIQSGINAFSSTAAIPIVGPALAPAAMAAALAVTQPMAASVASLSFAGAFDEGGKIPSGSFGIVGEFGPEFVRGPANVTSRKDTMDMVRSGGDQKITIINQGQPVRVISDTRISDDERQIIIADAAEAAEDRIASGIVRGDSNTSAALESTFSLDRSAGSRR